MTDPDPFAPHETRMLALEMAVEFVNGDARKSAAWKAEEVIDIAKKFEGYLTAPPAPGFDPREDGAGQA